MNKMSLSRTLLGTFAASVLAAGVAVAQTPSAPGTAAPPAAPGKVDRTAETKITETKTKETTVTGTQPATTMALTEKEAKAAKPVLQDVHKVNQLEIALGNLALQKATSQSVKDYATMMVTEHQAADKKVMDFANANNIMLTTNMPATREAPTTATDPTMRPPAGTTAGLPSPATATPPAPGAAAPPAGTPGSAASDAAPVTTPMELDAQGKRTLAKLEKLEGVKFEKAYLTDMVNGHKKTAAKLKTAEKRAQNPDLKTLIGDLRTSVETHLEKAKELQKAGST
jgi:predicted outer membrane protein